MAGRERYVGRRRGSLLCSSEFGSKWTNIPQIYALLPYKIKFLPHQNGGKHLYFMEKIHLIRDWEIRKNLWRDAGVQWNFVPTMGALHEGHASLIQMAAEMNGHVVVSIFVNPTQFNDPADFENYPASFELDCELAAEAGADVILAPSAHEIYRGHVHAEPVDFGVLTSTFEAAHRPGHFDGVVAIVDRLFQVVEPRRAVFGEKDLQQVAVVKAMANLRHPEVEVVMAPLIRDTDGLALSSRNVRLSGQARQTALALSQSLTRVQESFKAGIRLVAALEDARRWLRVQEGLNLAYLDVVHTDSFESQPDPAHHPCHVICAAEVEGVRLIDNIVLSKRPEPAIVP